MKGTGMVTHLGTWTLLYLFSGHSRSVHMISAIQREATSNTTIRVAVWMTQQVMVAERYN